MTIGAAIVLIAVGAVMKWAVTAAAPDAGEQPKASEKAPDKTSDKVPDKAPDKTPN